MRPAFPVGLGHGALNEANILWPHIPGAVPEENRLHDILLAPGECYTILSILTPAFSLFFFQRAKVLQNFYIE
jgi:hypothetical protein